ncbi:MAG: hypothetical protein U0L09_04940 [Christensenellales bacterium]|nr:hypothetical protein [Christensenellales bacterium]
MENMLFCPFCGSPIIIPSQDRVPLLNEAVQPMESAQPIESMHPERCVSKEDTFYYDSLRKAPRFIFENRTDESVTGRGESKTDVALPANTLTEETAVEPVVETSTKTVFDELEEAMPASKPVIVPEGEGFPGNFKSMKIEKKQARFREFLEEPLINRHKDSEGKREASDNKATGEHFFFEDVFDTDCLDEEQEHSFFSRHARGIVTLILLVLVSAVIVGWTMSDRGQLFLAEYNLAWKSAPYEELAYAAYSQQDYHKSAQYYENAFQREQNNARLANSAGIAYLYCGNATKSTEFARIVIDLEPNAADGYLLLTRLYPNPATRPWEITSMLKSGYEITGNEELKVD